MIKSGADAAADFQHPLKRVQGERAKMSQSVLTRVWSRLAGQLDIFRSLSSFMSSILVSPHI